MSTSLQFRCTVRLQRGLILHPVMQSANVHKHLTGPFHCRRRRFTVTTQMSPLF